MTNFDTNRMFTFVTGFAMGCVWNDVLRALNYARGKHGGQLRKDGSPYVMHPLTMACHAIALGIKDEAIVAAALLHDVCEDCGASPAELPVSAPVQDIVRRLTHEKGVPLDVYYRGIEECPRASIVKLLDRCHNVSTMAGVFTPAKTASYIEESRTYVLPLYRTAKNECPTYSNALFVLKYHVTSIIDGLEACMDACATKKENE